MMYTVLYGDTPSKLALKFAGSASKWPELCKANPQLPKHPEWGCVFTVGKQITLPSTWAPEIKMTIMPVISGGNIVGVSTTATTAPTPAAAAAPTPATSAPAPTPEAAKVVQMEEMLVTGTAPKTAAAPAPATATLATPAAAQATIFGMPRNMVLIGGGVVAVGLLAVVLMSGRKG